MFKQSKEKPHALTCGYIMPAVPIRFSVLHSLQAADGSAKRMDGREL